MRIEQIEIRNYRVFRDVRLTRLPPVTVVIGANGTGKSTLFDVFSFLKDALAGNVASAVARRGGFRELVSRGEWGPIWRICSTDSCRGSFPRYRLADSWMRGSGTPSRRARRTV